MYFAGFIAVANCLYMEWIENFRKLLTLPPLVCYNSISHERSENMKSAICDDSEIDRNIISDFLRTYTTEKSIPIQIAEYEDGVNLLYDVEDGKYYDLIFLDIYMAQIHGMDVARLLRKNKYSGKIIFLTSTSDFAVDSYEVDAAGYLLKPHDYNKIRNMLDRIFDRTDVGVFQFSVRNTVYNIPYSELVYVESSNNVCILHRSDGSSYTVYQRLSEIEEKLNDARFLRCHQSYIVNMSYISKADKQFELTTGDVVLIRQKSLKEIRNVYMEYCLKSKKQ